MVPGESRQQAFGHGEALYPRRRRPVNRQIVDRDRYLNGFGPSALGAARRLPAPDRRATRGV